MKRSCDDLDLTGNEMVTEDSGQHIEMFKKRCDYSDKGSREMSIMEFRDESNTSDENIIASKEHRNHTLVEREPRPGDYALVNPDLIGRKNYHELTELEACFSNASVLTKANIKNKIDVIGLQMKYLQETLQKAVKDSKRDQELHNAACNFVKKSGHTYHLYERPSGQKYFSMLSPQDWGKNIPHKFLSSWFLEADQSWTPAEEINLKCQGINFIKQVYGAK